MRYADSYLKRYPVVSTELGGHAPVWMPRSRGLLAPFRKMEFQAVTVPIVYVLASKKRTLHVGWTQNLPQAITLLRKERVRKGLETFSAVYWIECLERDVHLLTEALVTLTRPEWDRAQYSKLTPHHRQVLDLYHIPYRYPAK